MSHKQLNTGIKYSIKQLLLKNIYFVEHMNVDLCVFVSVFMCVNTRVILCMSLNKCVCTCMCARLWMYLLMPTLCSSAHAQALQRCLR